jgi:hypothetical protein
MILEAVRGAIRGEQRKRRGGAIKIAMIMDVECVISKVSISLGK